MDTCPICAAHIESEEKQQFCSNCDYPLAFPPCLGDIPEPVREILKQRRDWGGGLWRSYVELKNQQAEDAQKREQLQQQLQQYQQVAQQNQQLRQEVTSLQQQLQQYQQVAQQNQQLRQLIKKLQHNSEDWEYVGSPSQKPRWTQQKIREMEERIDQRNSGED